MRDWRNEINTLLTFAFHDFCGGSKKDSKGVHLVLLFYSTCFYGTYNQALVPPNTEMRNYTLNASG